MLKFIKKYHNFIEAIAMATVLLSWALENQSVKYWDKAIIEIRASQNSVIVAGGLLDAIGEIQLQAALTRQTLNSGSYDIGMGEGETYTAAWNSLEVRQSWHKSISNTYKGFSAVAQGIQLNNSFYKLGVDEDVIFINSALKRIWNILYPDDGSASQLIINPESHSLAKSLVETNASIAKKLNTTTARALMVCYEKQNKSSSLYFWTFIFGSFLLVIVKAFSNVKKRKKEEKKGHP